MPTKQKFLLIAKGDSYSESGNISSNPQKEVKKDKDSIRQIYQNKLKKWLNADNLIFLSGAGTSKDYGGKLVTELWDDVRSDIIIEKIPNLQIPNLQEFCKTIGFAYEEKSSKLEDLLSFAEKFIFIHKDSLTFNIANIEDYKDKIERLIHEKCKFTITGDIVDSPHYQLLKKLIRRPSNKPRFKIFTLNYDTAFEDAAQAGGYVLIDGFSFAQPRVFNGRFFDYDVVQRDNNRNSGTENYVENVFHLYKPHGSVTWEYDKGSLIQKDKAAVERPLMIYPNSTKYESSYKEPFFEMMSRFQQVLRKPESTTLIIIGFGLGDNHIMAMVNEALRQKNNLHIVIVNPYLEYDYNGDKFEGDDIWAKYANIALNSPHVMLVGEYFKDFVKHIPYADVKTENEIIGEQIRSILTEGKSNG